MVCPASLMGNWQREVEKFAPGTPVRRFHGSRRGLEGLVDGECVLTTYGTMRLDAPRLAAVPWGMVVADGAQHVKNPTRRRRGRCAPSAHARAWRSPARRWRTTSATLVILDWTTPGLLGSLGSFRTRYAQAVEGAL